MKLSIFCISLVLLTASVAAQEFPCDGKLYFFRYSNGQNQLSYVDGYLTPTPVVADACPLGSITGQNALAANPIDHFIYFTATPNNSVYRVDANCNMTVVCSNIASTSKGCFDYLGRYWIIDNSNNLIAYDLNTCTQVSGPFPLPSIAGIDIVFSAADCHFYMADQNSIIQVDTNGVITATYTPGFNAPGSFGGFAIGADGNLYGIPNSSTVQPAGNLYQYNLATQQPGGLIYTFPEGTAQPCGCDMASFPCPTLIADFTPAPSSGCGAPLTIQFANTSSGLVNSWVWDFGDSTHDTINYSPSHTYTQPGTYNVTLRVHAVTNCLIVPDDSISVTVNVYPLPNVVTTGDISLCVGQSAVLGVSGATTYAWSPSIGLSDTTGNSVTANPVVTTTYQIAGQDAATGCLDTAFITVTVNPLPLVVTPPAPVICTGGNVNINLSGALYYHWSPAVGIINVTGPDSSSVTVSLTQTTCYTVTGFSAEGCSATTNFCVTVNPVPVPVIVPSGPIVFCAGDFVDLTATPSGAYLWNTSDTSQTIHVTSGGTFTVTITDANGCVGTSSPETVTVNPLPVSSILPNGPLAFCDGGSVILTAGGGTSYLWSDLSISQNISVDAPGTYTVTVTDANNCSSTTSETVTVYPSPVAVITPDGPLSFCQGGQVVLTASGGTSFIWSDNSTSASITSNVTGTYTVTVTDANSCTASLSETVTVFAPPVSVISPTGPVLICSNNPAVLSANTGPGFVYQWYQNNISLSGEVNSTLTVTSTGSYMVHITDGNGCTATSSPVQVQEGLGPDVVITASPTIGCLQNTIYIGYGPQSVTLTAVSSTAVSYLWSTGETTQSISIITTATYSVTAYDINGCPSLNTPASQFAVNVIDIRCGQGKKKIILCHVPEGNPDNPQTICVAPSAIPHHLAHHDYDCIGPCSLYYRISNVPETDELFVYSYPNPFSGGFNLYVLAPENSDVHINIYDVMGKIIESYTDVTEQTLIGSKLSEGIYFAEVIAGSQRQTLRVIKSW